MSYNEIMTPRGDNYKEFENLKGYYLKLSYTGQDIGITIFNMESLDGIKYEISINKNFLYKMNNSFKNLGIKDIFQEFYKRIKENKYTIKKRKNKIDLTLVMEQNKKLLFDIPDTKNTNEYYFFLLNEIKKLRKDNKIINDLIQDNQKIKNQIKELKKLYI